MLLSAGYRVLVPDQRGYNLSDKPRGVETYRIEELAADAVGLIDACGEERAAAVIGHDWGGLVAWFLATEYPDRLERLGILNAPHPIVADCGLRSPAQLARSSYAFLFQLPCLPEVLLSAKDWLGVRQLLLRSSQPGTFREEELVRYRQAWEQTGAIEAMVNWYRAALRHRPRRDSALKVQAPTEIVWGAEDQVLGPQMARRSLQFCENGSLTLPPLTGSSTRCRIRSMSGCSRYWRLIHSRPDVSRRAVVANLPEPTGYGQTSARYWLYALDPLPLVLVVRYTV